MDRRPCQQGEHEEPSADEQALLLTQFAVDHAPDAVYWIDENARFVYVNDAACRSLGYSREELLQMGVPDIDPTWPMELWEDKWEENRKRGAVTFETVHRTKQGTIFPVNITASFIEFGGKSLDCAYARDISDRKASEEALRKTNEMAEEHKRRFYRETILSVTNGKLEVCDTAAVRPYISGASLRIGVNKASEVGPARREVEAYVGRHGLAGEELSVFVTGVGEAITNALKHGVRGRVYAGATEDEVWVGVRDVGPGIESLILPAAVLRRGFSTKPSLGLGYSIMLDAADLMFLATGSRGTTVVLIKSLRGKDKSSIDSIPDVWAGILDEVS